MPKGVPLIGCGVQVDFVTKGAAASSKIVTVKVSDDP